ncbi:type IV pilus biogenesis protein PilM [Spiribacter onubensis]|uniref:Pilus assembly protein PilM n=1 Tax=Spiribacter onubensis TaxID=3122420 RepID=A0ABV3S9P3_9GAMM
MLGPIRRDRTVLGVDIGATAIKVAAVDFRHRTPRLSGFAIETRPAGTEASSTMIRRAAAASAAHGRIAATAVPAEAVITRVIELPRGLDETALRARVSLDIEDSLRQPRDDVAHDFRTLRDDQAGESQTVLVVATRRDELQARRTLLTASGLRCRLVDVDTHAVARAALADARLRPPDDTRPTALLDIGTRLRLTVFDRQRILYQQDHGMKTDAATDERLEVIERALAVHHGSQESRLPAALALAGGGTDRQLASALGERVGIPAYCVDPRPAIAVDETLGIDGFTTRLPRLLTAIGLALHAGDDHAHWR